MKHSMLAETITSIDRSSFVLNARAPAFTVTPSPQILFHLFRLVSTHKYAFSHVAQCKHYCYHS
ncbi:hypothetical protein CBOM_07384 [Ceraceosorus bombacis]|uniref:Uncharacterized protein n=1 Tax=Ceraceosorus bombacis TaxID=401625 RepID=A0A0P1BC70_9BASI|nr:hypothetical protein CBOM_07384 [Ceraceosorus bombacis]